jgi:hypothetical protein
VSNDIKVLSFIANEMLRQTKNNLQFVRNLGGDDLAGRFTESPKKGDTIKVRKQARFVGRDGETFSAEDYLERTVDVAVQTTAGVDLSFTNRELMLSLDMIAEKVVKPAAETLANKIDTAALLLAVNSVANAVGTPGTIPTALKTYNQARAKMSWEGCPNDGQTLLVTPDMQVEAVDSGKTLFNPNGEIGSQYETGVVGRHAGAKVYEVQGLPTHTVGPLGGTPLVNGASQSGASLITDGWTAAAASRLKKGDIFTIANVYAANPWTRKSTGSLRQFTVTADVSSDGSGNATLAISPAIVTSGPYQNVDAGPADNAAITVLGAASAVTPQGLRFHRDAFIFGSLDQPMPQKAVEFAKLVSDPLTGLKIRYIRDWDTQNNKQLDRFDVVWVFGVAFPEFAVRVQS